MGNARTDAIRAEFTSARSELQALDALTRDLTDDERARSTDLIARMDRAEASLNEHQTRQRRLDVGADVTRSLGLGDLTRGEAFAPELADLSHGELLHRTITASFDRNGRDDFETLQRTLQHGVNADGTHAVSVEGALTDFVDANRYAVNSATQHPIPSNGAPTFIRPFISQHSLAGEQVTEGDVLQSRRLIVDGDTITKKVYGTVLSMSESELSWCDPSMLDVTVKDMAKSYGLVTDNVLCDAIEAASTASAATTLSLTAAGPDVLEAIAAAAQVAYGTCGKLPNVIYAAVDRWFYLASLTGDDGRPLFPVTGANVNGAGSNPGGLASFGSMSIMGLTVIPDPAFTANLLCVANTEFVEVYEEQRGLLQVQAVTVLETQVAWRGWFATRVLTEGFGALEHA